MPCCTVCLLSMEKCKMPYFTFSSIFHERLNGQFSLFPLKISAVGRSKNGEGVLQVVIQGLLKEKVLLIFLPKYRRGVAPLPPSRFRRVFQKIYKSIFSRAKITCVQTIRLKEHVHLNFGWKNLDQEFDKNHYH